MNDPKKIVIFTLITLVCVVGGGGLLYLGNYFFHDRAVPFWTFSTYIVVLTIIVIYFAYKFIFVSPGQDEE